MLNHQQEATMADAPTDRIEEAYAALIEPTAKLAEHGFTLEEIADGLLCMAVAIGEQLVGKERSAKVLRGLAEQIEASMRVH